MKKLSLALVLCLVIGMFAGCAGTPVIYYTDCTCPAGSHDVAAPAVTEPAPAETEAPVLAEGAVMTGLAVVAGIEVTAPTADAEGKAAYDVTFAAVNVDENGVIVACRFDSLGEDVLFDAAGTILTADGALRTKHEKGFEYNMVNFGVSTKEWFEQANALADYAVGKTVEELRNGAVNAEGRANDVDLATTATIKLGGYVDAIEQAVKNAKHLGAQAGDELVLTTINTLEGGNLLSDVAAVTVKDGVITSCCLDSLQAELIIAEDGTVTAGNTLTKNQKGYDYNMVNFGVSKLEWFEHAENFASYIVGKTAAEVAGIAVNEESKPAEVDLATSVTISIDGFQALIAKALG